MEKAHSSHPGSVDTMHCTDPVTHARWCQCKKVNEALLKRVAELEAAKFLSHYSCKIDGCEEVVEVTDVVCPQCTEAIGATVVAVHKRTAQALNESHARETALNRKMFDMRNSYNRMREGINGVIVRIRGEQANTSTLSRVQVATALSNILQAEPLHD